MVQKLNLINDRFLSFEQIKIFRLSGKKNNFGYPGIKKIISYPLIKTPLGYLGMIFSSAIRVFGSVTRHYPDGAKVV